DQPMEAFVLTKDNLGLVDAAAVAIMVTPTKADARAKTRKARRMGHSSKASSHCAWCTADGRRGANRTSLGMQDRGTPRPVLAVAQPTLSISPRCDLSTAI